MDSNGVPQKINRHVFKAVTHYSVMRNNGTKFSEVLEYVRLCNRNLKPVTNLKTAVRKALENFQRFGLIQKDRSSRYKIIKLPIYKNDINSTTPAKRKSLEPQDCSPQKKNITAISRKRNLSVDSVLEDDVETARKRFKTQKNLNNREGKKAKLPKSRRAPADSLSFHADVSKYQNLELAGNNMSTTYIEDDFLSKEPGADDRDSGDDLRIKSRSTFSGEVSPDEDVKQSDIIEKTENNPPNQEIEEQSEKNNDNSNGEASGPSTTFAKNNISFRPYLN